MQGDLGLETQLELVVLDGPQQPALRVDAGLNQGMELGAVDGDASTPHVFGLVHGAVRRGEQR